MMGCKFFEFAIQEGKQGLPDVVSKGVDTIVLSHLDAGFRLQDLVQLAGFPVAGWSVCSLVVQMQVYEQDARSLRTVRHPG